MGRLALTAVTGRLQNTSRAVVLSLALRSEHVNDDVEPASGADRPVSHGVQTCSGASDRTSLRSLPDRVVIAFATNLAVEASVGRMIA